MKPDLSIHICGRRFKNPVVVSLAQLGGAGQIKRCVETGAGGIVAGTLTDNPVPGQCLSSRYALLHREGWPHVFSNYYHDFPVAGQPGEWLAGLRFAVKHCHEHEVILVGRIYSGTPQGWTNLARLVEDAGVDMLELDFGCAHARDLEGHARGLEGHSGRNPGGEPEAAAEVAEAVVSAVKVPVYVKIATEAADPVRVARKSQEKGISGITSVSRFSALEIDLETGRPLLQHGFAGLDGPWMRPIMLKWVARIAREIDIPVSAANGIWEWQDVVKAIMAGASTVQASNSLIYSPAGYKKIAELVSGLDKFMDDHGYRTISQMRGITLPQILPRDKPGQEDRAISLVDAGRCNGCGCCLSWCDREAISRSRLDGGEMVSIDSGRCDGCGICASLCPRRAVRITLYNSPAGGDGNGPVTAG